MDYYFYLVFVVLSVVYPQNQACDSFIKRPGNDVSATPYKTVPHINWYKAISHCLDDTNCLSFSYDSENQEARLYDNWNEDEGGEYELKTRCPRKPKHHYSRTLDLCFSVEDTKRRGWIDSADWCENNGRSRLLVLDTQEKVDFLLQSDYPNRRWFNLANGEIFYWVDGDYNGTNYMWSNGVELLPGSTMWHATRPINNNNYRYLVLDVDPSDGILDEIYNGQHYFLCEYTL